MENENIVPVYDQKKINQLRVVQGNDLIRFKKTPMTIVESRLVRYIISQISMSDTELLSYKINSNQLAEAIGVDRHNVYPVFRKLSESLAEKYVYRETGKSKNGKQMYMFIPWFKSIGYDEDDNLILSLNDQLEEYVLSLKAFTNYRFVDVLTLPSDNTVKLYELIISWSGKPSIKEKDYTMYGHKLGKNEVIFSIEYLRNYFDCNEKYKLTTDFIKRIIEPNVKIINEKVFGLKYKVLKQNGKSVAMLFMLGY